MARRTDAVAVDDESTGRLEGCAIENAHVEEGGFVMGEVSAEMTAGNVVCGDRGVVAVDQGKAVGLRMVNVEVARISGPDEQGEEEPHSCHVGEDDGALCCCC